MNTLRRQLSGGSFAGLLLVLAIVQIYALCQAVPPSNNDKRQADTPYVLKMTTREVVVEVVARDRHNHPVNDLKQDELQVMEIEKHSLKLPKMILAFHVINPAKANNSAEQPSAGFRLTSGGGCAVSTTMHYELVYPASSESGYHEILVTTSRPHVTLSFRHRYYVGETDCTHEAAASRRRQRFLAGGRVLPLRAPLFDFAHRPVCSSAKERIAALFSCHSGRLAGVYRADR